MEHTALPWAVEEGFRKILLLIVDSTRDTIGIVQGQGWANKANAEYIVKACNAYPELVEALKSALGSMVCLCGTTPTGWHKEIIDNLLQVLAKLGKE